MNIYFEDQVPWPKGKPLTKNRRSGGPFKSAGSDIPLQVAADRVIDQIAGFNKNGGRGANRVKEVWVYVSAKIGASGRFLRNQPANLDPRVVVSFDVDAAPYTVSVDVFEDPAQNLAAIAQAIEGMRSTERYGVFTVAQLMQSFAALPASTGNSLSTVSPFDGLTAPAQIESKYRELAKEYHPDKPGGSTQKMAELNAQKEEAIRRLV